MPYCMNCKTIHDGNCCPPHEVRWNGIEGIRKSLSQAEAEIMRLTKRIEKLRGELETIADRGCTCNKLHDQAEICVRCLAQEALAHDKRN